jgi:hypothetical protein
MMTLVACGDGDGDLLGGTDGGTSPDAITLTIVKDTEGDLSLENNISLTATVLQGGDAIANKTVTFTLAVDGTATFDPVVGTATTDANGNASIVVKVSDIEGSVNVIATHESASDDISFNSLGDGIKVVDGEPEAALIQLFANSAQIASSGAQLIELTAIAKDNDNNLVEGVSIDFRVDSGTLAKVIDDNGQSSAVTGPDGKLSMMLSTESDPSNRTITATILSGDIGDTILIEVVGTTVTFTGTSSLALNDEASYVINLLNSDAKGIANTPVELSLSGISTENPEGNIAEIVLPTTLITTDSDGQAIVKITGTSGGTNSILVNALGATATQKISVQSDSFLFTAFSNGVDNVNPSQIPILPDVGLTKTASLTLTWKREGELVPDGTLVSFTSTRGLLSETSGSTLNGKVTVNLTSSDAGKSLVTFVGKDIVDGKEIELTNQIEFEFFAENAATLIAQASPYSIGPDEQTSTISVVVRDPNQNLVKNKRIKFILSDVNGGSIFPATAITDSSGIASTIYTSKGVSAQDGVAIKAVVEDTPSVEDNVFLTVADRELFITLGAGNELDEPNVTDYLLGYSIFVSDVDSAAIANVELTVSAIPNNYYKGLWLPLYNGGEFDIWRAVGFGSTTKPDIRSELPLTKCPNEDINFNGILDAGEDTNKDGTLTPGNVVAISGNQTTDENGQSTIRINYPQSYAQWVDIRLVVSAKVTGSESSTQAIFTLPVLESDIDTERRTPPLQGVGYSGPFGFSPDCSMSIADES